MNNNKFKSTLCCIQKYFCISKIYKIIIILLLFIISIFYMLNIKLQKDICEDLKSITLVQKDVIEYYILEQTGKVMRNVNVLKNNPSINLRNYLQLACVYDENIINYIVLDKNKNLIENINNKNHNYKNQDLSFLDSATSSNVTISPIFYDKYEKKSLMYIGGVIYNTDKSVRYYVLSVIYPHLLFESIEQDNKSNKVNFYLLDKSKIIYSSKNIDKKLMKKEYKNLIYNLDTKFNSRIIERAVPYRNSEGKQVYGYMTSIDETDWNIIYEQEKKYMPFIQDTKK